MLSTIIQTIAKWATSFTGILTIMIIMVTAIRLALTSVREKYGKESRRYRNMKLISGVACLIITINVISIFICSHITWLWGFLNQSLWYQCFAFATCYIAASSIALKCLSSPIAFITNIALAFFGNYIDKAIELTPRVTIATCVVAFLATLELTDTISQKRKEASKNSNIEAITSESAPENDDIKTVSPDLVSTNFFARHGFLAAMLWIGSLVAAYLAGEYSLVPKAIEYIQSQLKKYSASADKTATSETADKNTTATTIPTGTD